MLQSHPICDLRKVSVIMTTALVIGSLRRRRAVRIRRDAGSIK